MPVFPALLAAKTLTKRTIPLMESYALSTKADTLLDVGPVPMPSGGRLPVLRSVQDSVTPSQRSTRVAICCFGMTLLQTEAYHRLILQLCRQANHTIFLDFKVPERNLEWPAYLLFSPLRHQLSSGRGMPTGGMEAILYKERDHCTVVQRHTLHAGALCLMLVRNHI